MSADKYPSIFSRQMEAIVYIELLLNHTLIIAVLCGTVLTTLSAISVNLLAFYHERRSLIGYATHYLFNK